MRAHRAPEGECHGTTGCPATRRSRIFWRAREYQELPTPHTILQSVARGDLYARDDMKLEGMPL